MKCAVCKSKFKGKDIITQIVVEHDGIMGVKHRRRPEWWNGRKMNAHDNCAKAYNLAKRVVVSAGVPTFSNEWLQRQRQAEAKLPQFGSKIRDQSADLVIMDDAI